MKNTYLMLISSIAFGVSVPAIAEENFAFEGYAISSLPSSFLPAEDHKFGFTLVIKKNDIGTWDISSDQLLQNENSEKLLIVPSRKLIAIDGTANGSLESTTSAGFVNQKGGITCKKVLHSSGARNKNSYDICQSNFLKEIPSTGMKVATTFFSFGISHLSFFEIDKDKVTEALKTIPDQEGLASKATESNQKLRKDQARISIETKRKNTLIEERKLAFLANKTIPGTKVCQLVGRTPSQIAVTAFLETDAGENIKFSIISIVDKNYPNITISLKRPDGSVWVPNLTAWDKKQDWTFCD